MLLRDLSRNLNPNVVKAVAEIYLDIEGNSDPKSRELSVDLGDNISFSDDGFYCLLVYLSSKGYKGNSQVLIDKIKEYLVIHGISSITRDYVHITKQYNILRSKIVSDHKNYDFDRILDLFIAFFNSNSLDAYDWDSAGFGAHITNTFHKMFLNKYHKEVYAIVNEQGTSIETSGSVLDLEDKLVVEDVTTFSSFDFQRDVKCIHEASKLLFPINPKNPSDLYSDLIAAYKYYTTEKKKPELAKYISNVFCPGKTYFKSSNFLASSGYFTSILTEGPNDQTIDYRRFTFTHRLLMTERLFDAMNSEMTGDLLKNLYNSLVNLDINIADCKNKSKLFTLSDINTVFDNGANKEKFDVLLSGVISFKLLLEYCMEKDISIYSIPSDVVGTDQYYKRFQTLEQCLSCYDVTSALISSTGNSKLTSLLSNDETYDDLIAKSDFNFLSLQSCLSSDCEIADKINPNEVLPIVLEILSDFASTYSEFATHVRSNYDDNFTVASSKYLDGSDEVLVGLMDGLIGDYLSEFNKIVVDDDLSIVVSRYGWLKIFTLERLKDNLSYLSANTRFDTLVGLSENKLHPLPSSINTLDDLQIVSNNIPLHSSGVLTSSSLNQFRTLYSVIQKELLGIIEKVNRLIIEKGQELERIGIRPKNTILISGELQKVSSHLYDVAYKHFNQSLDIMLTLDNVRVEHGFVVYKSQLYKYKGYLVHENGYLVNLKGNSVIEIKQELVIFDEGCV